MSRLFRIKFNFISFISLLPTCLPHNVCKLLCFEIPFSTLKIWNLFDQLFLSPFVSFLRQIFPLSKIMYNKWLTKQFFLMSCFLQLESCYLALMWRPIPKQCVLNHMEKIEKIKLESPKYLLHRPLGITHAPKHNIHQMWVKLSFLERYIKWNYW